ncbi:kinase-like protein, partial [Aureobasidium melanogenum]
MSGLRRFWNSLFRRPWAPLTFPNEGFVSISADAEIEEETLPDYATSHFYPVRIGEILRDRCQIVGKLGFGGTSTVWLARDLSERKHVAIKLYVQSESIRSHSDTELGTYKRIENAPKHHPGRTAVREHLDSFRVQGPRGSHRCLVHPALWESVLDLRHRNSIQRLPASVVAFILKRLFHALDLLHNECSIAHTDIKEANILLGADDSVLQDFECEQLRNPCPRKELPEGTIYRSRKLNMPRAVGEPVLCDFGSAVPLDDGVEHREDIQPDVYRAPEIILDIPWSYSVDIWNAGCVAWDAFEGRRLFNGDDPELGTYRGRAHLAEMIALLGQPPQALLARADLRSKFFSEPGKWKVSKLRVCGNLLLNYSTLGQWTAGIPIPESTPFEARETALIEGNAEDREAFLRLMRKMIQWEPEKRGTARELAEDEWILKHTT